MKKIALTLLVLVSFMNINAQSIIGKWKTIDDETGKPKSIVEIYKQGDKYFGKIVKLITAENSDGICRTCETKYKNKNIIGLVILTDFEKDDDEYEDGEIINPKNGKVYSAYLELLSPNKLKVRGYIGFSLIGKTQYWYRVQ